MILTKLVTSGAALTLIAVATPAAAANMIQITGYYSLTDNPQDPEPVSVNYRAFFNPNSVITEYFPQGCVYDCRIQFAAISMVKGRIGVTQIPGHKVTGQVVQTFDDASFLSLDVVDSILPSVGGQYQAFNRLDVQFSETSEPTYGGFYVDLPNGSSRQLYNSVATYASVPEPGIWLMLLLGFGALGSVLRRRLIAVLPPNGRNHRGLISPC